MTSYCKCSVALPEGTVDWSAVCDCGHPDHHHLLFDIFVVSRSCNWLSLIRLKPCISEITVVKLT